MRTHNWHISTKEVVTGSHKRPVPDPGPGVKRDDSSSWARTPNTDTVWFAETRLANGTRYDVGHSSSEAEMNAKIDEAERRWSLPENPHPNGHPAKESDTLIDERRVVTGDGKVVRVFYRYLLPPKTDVAGMTFTDPNAAPVPVKRFGLFGSV